MSSIKKELDSILGSNNIETSILNKYTKITFDIAMFNPKNKELGKNFIVTIFQNVFKDPILLLILPEINAINIHINSDSDSDIAEIKSHLLKIQELILKVQSIYNELLLKKSNNCGQEQCRENTIKTDTDFEKNKGELKKFNFYQEDPNYNGVSVKESNKYIEGKVNGLKDEVQKLINYYDGKLDEWSFASKIWYWTGGWIAMVHNRTSYSKMKDIYEGFKKVHIGSIDIDIDANIKNLESAKRIIDLQVTSTQLILEQENKDKVKIYVDNLERQISTFFERLYIADPK